MKPSVANLVVFTNFNFLETDFLLFIDLWKFPSSLLKRSLPLSVNLRRAYPRYFEEFSSGIYSKVNLN
jgi:hypothetical protein